jgi:hypothetical protein
MDRILAFSGAFALVAALCSCSTSGEGLSPDLNISLDCSQPLRAVDEIALEKRLYSIGFDVLNRARLAREMRVEFSPPVMIDAIDAEGRMVSVTGFGEIVSGQEQMPTYLGISLYSRPPTSRDAKLETQLESLAADVPKCSVRKVERHVNPASIDWLYRDITKRTRGWFAQAKDSAPASVTHRVH